MLPFLTRTREGHDVLPITYVLLRSTLTIDDGALRPTTLSTCKNDLFAKFYWTRA
ncbi:hypothetical protein PISMIDRAFT_184177 [Pisolithus microcarpus 441]|uniref:Uncharacterized protein n=1 Tax=Pisolithus microcarpus 441 TaxID=765257 RepID=A0A0C9YQS3_9AGAM|nr:hypothetical protein PISMIDRAFT_184177 [Pisolithus microcarpus 441]